MNWEAGRPACSVPERLAWPLAARGPATPARCQFGLGFVPLWEGRRTAPSPVNAASIGSAASLMNVPGCAAKGLASLPAAHGGLQDQEGLLHSLLLEFHCSVRDGARGCWLGTHQTPVAGVVEPSFYVFLWLRLSRCWPSSTRLARKVSGCQIPGDDSGARGPLLFADSSWKWAQSEG